MPCAVVHLLSMGIGGRMWKLWNVRTSVAIAFLLAVVITIWSQYDVRLAPPSLAPRTMTMATATTQLVVDTPKSTMLDLSTDTYSFMGLRNRAILLGSLVASSPVRDDIGRRVGIPGAVIEVAAPRTPEQPRAVVGASADKKTTDLLRSNKQYRLSIQVDPTVPVLDIYAESPSADVSAALANAAVDSLKSYVSHVAKADGTPLDDQARLRQLGRASGAVINGGVSKQAAILVFLLAFTTGCAAALFVKGVRRDWRSAAAADPVEAA